MPELRRLDHEATDKWNGPLWQRIVAGIDEKTSRVQQAIHPSWQAAVRRYLGLPDDFAGDGSEQAERIQERLVRRVLRLEWPGLHQFENTVWRISVLPLQPMLLMLCTIGLYEQRARVRLTLAKSIRQHVTGLVGERSFALMQDERTVRQHNLAPLQIDELQADTLARRGIDVLEALCQRRPYAPCPWVRAAVACPHAIASPQDLLWQPPRQMDAQRVQEATEVHGQFEYLPRYFPEFQWLFGSFTENTHSPSMTM